MRGVLTSDRGFGLSGDGRKSGVGGPVHSGVGGASERLGDEEGGGGPDPDAGHGGQNLVMRVGRHQGLDLGGGVGPLSVQGDELARQVGRHHASDVGAGDHQQGNGIVDCDLCRRCHGQAAHPGEQARPSTVCTCRAHKLRTSCQLERETGRGQEGERAGQSRGRLTDRARAYKHREPSPA